MPYSCVRRVKPDESHIMIVVSITHSSSISRSIVSALALVRPRSRSNSCSAVGRARFAFPVFFFIARF